MSFLVTGSGYLSPDWVLDFVITTPTPVAFRSVNEVPDHRIIITPEQSAALKYGRTGFSLVWSNVGEGKRKTDGMGTILLVPDPKVALAPSWAMSCLAKAEASILKLSSGSNSQVQVDGQIYTKRNFAELISLRDRLISIVESELLQIGRPVTRGGSKTIHTRFC